MYEPAMRAWDPISFREPSEDSTYIRYPAFSLFLCDKGRITEAEASHITEQGNFLSMFPNSQTCFGKSTNSFEKSYIIYIIQKVVNT